MEQLSDEQINVLQACLQGKNVFMSGPGGCGKTYLIKHIYESMKIQKHVQVCALTGCAAELLDCSAKTIHSWSGTKLNDNYKKVILRKQDISKWKKIQLLIIDEVSMMSVKYFELLDTIGKKVRKNNKPFGGIQLLFSGDFHQLPPVGSESDPQTCEFCFQSKLWNETFHEVILLQTIFRQNDKTFLKILRQIRRGGLTQKSYDLLLKRKLTKDNNLLKNKHIKPTMVCPLKRKVKQINDENLKNITTEIIKFPCQINTIYDHSLLSFSDKKIKYEIDKCKKNMVCDDILHLKIGSRVMCIINLQMARKDNKQIVNGSQGIVENIVDGIPLIRFDNGILQLMEPYTWENEASDDLMITIKQIPLILSWAITIHKSQGITLDSAIIDAGDNIFEYGQIYVALSRVRSLDGLYLCEFNGRKIMTNPEVIKYYSSL